MLFGSRQISFFRFSYFRDGSQMLFSVEQYVLVKCDVQPNK